jgi:hypothetical protein
MWFLMGQFTFCFYILARVMHKEISVMDSNNFDKLSRSLDGTSSRRQALKLMGGGLIGGAAMAVGLKGATAQRPVFADNYMLPVITGIDLGEAGTLDATLSPTSFLNSGGVLSVVGDVFDSAGDLVGSFTGTVDTAQTEATCDILNLVLGPLELDVLGLVIEIPEPVILNIFAQPGEGKLLGNLLCAVAGLLDRNGPLSGLSGLLNNILRALGLA